MAPEQNFNKKGRPATGAEKTKVKREKGKDLVVEIN
jgi:hypothetical protein